MENTINPAVGIIDILIDAINKKYDNIRDLNSLNVNLSEENYESMIPVIDSIIENENNSIGKLQQLINLLGGSEEDIEEGKQETIEIIDTNEFVESITTMKKKLILSENFDNVIDDVQAVADPVFVGANEEHDENKKKYEDAMEENKKAAEDTIPDEGDTGKEVKSAALKAMHLSEELFEDLSNDFAQWCADDLSEYILTQFVDLKNSEIRQVLKLVMNHFSGSDFEESLKEDLSFDAYDDFNHEIYNAIADVCYKFSDRGLSKKDIEAALEWFETHFEEDDFEFETKEEEEIVEESLDSDAQRQLNSDVYNAFGDLAFKYYQKEMPLDKEDFKKAFDSFMFRFFKESDEAQAKGYLWSEEEQGWIDPSLEESLNESFVAEWWGQVDGDTPQEVAERYNLKVKPIKNNLDEILYKFEGKLEDFSKAMDDGYFYSLTVQQDAGHSEDIDSLLYESIQSKIAKEQIKRFTEGKMPKNWNVNSYLNRLVESKHITKKEAKSLKEWYSKNK